MLYQHPRQLPHQHLNLKNKFINFKNYKKQKNIIKNKKKIVELRSVTNPETQRPVFLFLPRNRPLPFLPVLFLLLRLAQNPPRPEQPTRLSSQFYTFNPESHSLMIRCLLEHRLATPMEIRATTPQAVLKLWRAVWKDRNEDTAWKQIQLANSSELQFTPSAIIWVSS